MSTLTLRVEAKDGSNQHIREIELKIDDLRTTPNPRQAINSHVLYMVRDALKKIDPSIII